MMVAVAGSDQPVRGNRLLTRAAQARLRFVLSYVCGFVLLAVSARAGHPTEPNAELTPSEVVAAQLDALKNNEGSDRDEGIRITFRFASPENQAQTGPVDRFVELVKNPMYAALLNHRTARFGEMMIVDRSARQKVSLNDRYGKPATFVFILSKQSGPPCPGCWMTDAVIRSENHLPAPRIALNGGLNGGYSSD